MLPVIAIVGRPNVGKSTLFNRITKTRDALVADMPGVTRDRQYGDSVFQDKPFIVVDTGGVGDEGDDIESLMSGQSWQAATEADVIIFLVDAREGLSAVDDVVAKQLRKLQKTIFLVANKIDGLDPDLVLSEFYSLGLGELYAISSAHNRGIIQLLEEVTKKLP